MLNMPCKKVVQSFRVSLHSGRFLLMPALYMQARLSEIKEGGDDEE